MDFAATLEAARALSVDERIELINIIWNEIADEGAVPDLTDAQKAELDRRLAALEADPDSGIPWETVKAEFEATMRR
jgi:putative addiction module component (TIGR02574 family)